MLYCTVPEHLTSWLLVVGLRGSASFVFLNHDTRLWTHVVVLASVS